MSGSSTWRTLPPLPQDRQLHAIVARQDVGPGQGDHFGDAQAAGIDDLKQHAVPLGRGRTDQEADLDLRDDALGQVGAAAAGVGAHLDGGAGIEGGVAERVGVAEKRLDAQHVLARGGLRQAAHSCW